MSGENWNPLSSFQEMGTLSKVLLLIGVVLLSAALWRGSSLSDPMFLLSLASIALSLSVHYFSESRRRVSDGDYTISVTNKGQLWVGIVTSLATIALLVLAVLVHPNQKAKDQTTATADASHLSNAKPADVPVAPPEKKDTFTVRGVKQSSKGKPFTSKNVASGNGTQAAGDNSSAIGSVQQGPCSVLQAGGSNNQAIGGNCGPKPLKLSEKQGSEVTKLLSSFKGEAVEIDVDRATPETDQFAKALRSSLLLAGITSTRVNAMFVGGCVAYPGVSFMAGVNRQVLVKAIWDALVKEGVLDKADSIPGCSRSGEPNELHIYIRPNS